MPQEHVIEHLPLSEWSFCRLCVIPKPWLLSETQHIMEVDGTCWKGSQRPCGLKSFNKRVQGSAKGLNLPPPPPPSSVITNSYFTPSVVGKVLHREAELLDTEPFANDARHRQKGPLLRCQDNATAAIVKSQGYCVVDFSAGLQRPAQYSRHTETHSSTNTHKDDREMWQNWTLLLLWSRGSKEKRRARGGNKRGAFQKTLLNAQIKGSEGKKSMCAERKKNKIINSE